MVEANDFVKVADILRSKQKGLGNQIQILECPPLESAITIERTALMARPFLKAPPLPKNPYGTSGYFYFAFFRVADGMSGMSRGYGRKRLYPVQNLSCIYIILTKKR